MNLLINILLTFYVTVALLMILVILMQRPKSEGLGAAFGGGVTENIFGAQTTNVLTKITSWLATIFFLLTFALSILYAHQGSTKSELRSELMKGLPTTNGTPSPTSSPGSSPTESPNPSSTASPSASPEGTSSESAATSPTSSPVASPAPSSTVSG
jgi:preprotein translocase subunit SecG